MPAHRRRVGGGNGSRHDRGYDRLSTRAAQPQRGRDRREDFILDLEEIGRLALVSLRPDVEATIHAYQMSSDPQPVARLPNGAEQHRSDAEFPADPGWIVRPSR